MRHYQEICGDARAGQPDASANANAMLNALMSMTAANLGVPASLNATVDRVVLGAAARPRFHRSPT